jgi:Fe-S cluster biogenesis protein NfuA
MTTETNPVEISAEMTPNPNTLKFNVNKVLMASGSVNFPDADKAKGSFAEELFTVENVIGVMVGRDFITVTKSPAANWQTMVEPVTKKIRHLFETNKFTIPQAGRETSAEGTGVPGAPASDNIEIENKIRKILDAEIRPAVNMDGGDITFHGYYDGVVTLHLQGSCSSCPSAIMTLKMGVENRLKAMIPEIREVVQV